MKLILLFVVMHCLVACRITSLKYCICEQALRKIIQNHVRHLPICATLYGIIWEAFGVPMAKYLQCTLLFLSSCLVHSARDTVPNQPQVLENGDVLKPAAS